MAAKQAAAARKAAEEAKEEENDQFYSMDELSDLLGLTNHESRAQTQQQIQFSTNPNKESKVMSADNSIEPTPQHQEIKLASPAPA